MTASAGGFAAIHDLTLHSAKYTEEVKHSGLRVNGVPVTNLDLEAFHMNNTKIITKHCIHLNLYLVLAMVVIVL